MKAAARLSALTGPVFLWDSGADESHRLDFGWAKQRRHVASLRRVLTLGPHGFKAAADKAKRSAVQSLLCGATLRVAASSLTR
jgi:hypothetical protein